MDRERLYPIEPATIRVEDDTTHIIDIYELDIPGPEGIEGGGRDLNDIDDLIYPYTEAVIAGDSHGIITSVDV